MSKETLNVDALIKSIFLATGGFVVVSLLGLGIFGSMEVLERFISNKYIANRQVVVNFTENIKSDKVISKESIDNTEGFLQSYKYNYLNVEIESAEGNWRKVNKNDTSSINLKTGDMISVSAYYDESHYIKCVTFI